MSTFTVWAPLAERPRRLLLTSDPSVAVHDDRLGVPPETVVVLGP